MKARELTEFLSKIDPEDEIFVQGGDGLVYTIDNWYKHYAVWFNTDDYMYVLPDDEVYDYSPEDLIPVYLLVAEGA